MFMIFKFLFIIWMLIFSLPVFSCENYRNENTLKAIDDYSISGIINKSDNGDKKFQYLLGIIYFVGYENKDVKIDKNFEKAIPLLKSASEKGVGPASRILAYYYSGKVDNKKNQDLYADYLLKAAECGIPDAQNELAHFYNDSKNGKYYSLSKAAYWYEKAAENGNIDSILAIAWFYSDGIGVEKDLKKSFYWLSKAVEQDDLGAELDIAKYYAEGISTDKDLVKAYMMYDLAGTAGVPHKDKLAKQMTPEQIQEAIQKSRQWQEEHHHYRPGYYGLRHQSDGSYQ